MAPLDDLFAQASLLGPEFYCRDTVAVARELLGRVLVHEGTAGRIVEVEAYLGVADQAAHFAKGMTNRTRVVFGPAGHTYIYLIYGMYDCLNIVTEPDGTAGCVLVRALEPLCGVSRMQARRAAAREMRELASGPGRLTQALGLTRQHNGLPLFSPQLCVLSWRNSPPARIAASGRIGIRLSAGQELRFFDAGSVCVSGPRTLRKRLLS